MIGRRPDATDCCFLDGAVDELRIYNRALNSSEVSTLYNSGAGQYGQLPDSGLVGGWHFDEGTGNEAEDYSGNSDDADLEGGAGWTTGHVQAPTGDTQAPTVSLTAPANNAAVRGTITVSADASDNVGVVGVQFKLDGANLGAEDTTSPYSVSWNTTTASQTTHSLAAVARDAATNSTPSTARTVTVDNTNPVITISNPDDNELITP